MSLEIDEPLFFQLTIKGLLTRTAKVLGRLAPLLLPLALALAAMHWLSPFSRHPSELLAGWGLPNISVHTLVMLIPLYLAFIPIYGVVMATLRGEPAPTATNLVQSAIEKLPFCLLMIILEGASPTNIWIVLVVFAFAWLLQDKIAWEKDDPDPDLETQGRKGVFFVFVGLLLISKSIVESLASGHPLAESLAYGVTWAVLFTASSVYYHDHRLLARQLEDSEEEIQRALAEARDAQIT